ncbi:unnamed protein product [Mytilus coruscus]|uniref:Uncharacterized protein n=1 Tax=Mytilus coruscus TaxID=42192 RepID=A0A6J8B4L4_MYTCO|nr:unnamed protein product [Mytilus coruscus]
MQHEEEDQVLLNDHEYSIPNKALQTSEKVAEDFIKEAVSINTSINSYNSSDSLNKQLSSLLHRLNKVHITMSDESKRHLMRDLSYHSDEMIKEHIAKGNDGKLNGDNLDIYVTTNDIRMENKNKDYHFFGSDITFDRVKVSRLSGDLDNLQVPVGGDQLTRVRLQGAKSLRAGAFTAEDRLEHLTPIVVEMFHTLQDFLETHEDFVLTVGCAYFLNFIMQHFKMKDLADTPLHPKMQKNIKMMHNHHKKELWSTLMNDIVDELVKTFPKQVVTNI